jgi:hypothetical protein
MRVARPRPRHVVGPCPGDGVARKAGASGGGIRGLARSAILNLSTNCQATGGRDTLGALSPAPVRAAAVGTTLAAGKLPTRRGSPNLELPWIAWGISRFFACSVEHLGNAVRGQDALRPDPQVVSVGGLHPGAATLRYVRAELFLDQPQEQCGLALLDPLLDPLLAPSLEPPPKALLDSRTLVCITALGSCGKLRWNGVLQGGGDASRPVSKLPGPGWPGYVLS